MKLVHRRTIDISVTTDGGDNITVTARLADTRGRDLTTFSGREVPAGDELHGMEVELTVGRDLRVEKAAARMPFVPETGCEEAASRVRALIGLKLGRGFSREVRQRIGGRDGCQHLTALVMAMAPAAMQGYWAYFGGPIRTGRLDLLLDTCHVFQADSPVVQRLRAELAKATKGEEQEKNRGEQIPVANRS